MNANGNEKKRFDYRHIICIAITLGFILCGVFLFPRSFYRIIESGRDFGKSVAYYFCELLSLPYFVKPTVNNLPAAPAPSPLLPDTYGGFKRKCSAYWRLWANGDNFIQYISAIGNAIGTLCKAIIVVLPVILALWLLFKRSFKRENNDYNHDSRPLRAFKFFSSRIYSPVKNFIVNLYRFIREHKPYYITWLCLWLFYFNAFTIVLEFLAFYLYFASSFDIGSIYRQVYKLFLDLSVPFRFIPLWLWAVFGIILFDRFRKRIAYARLHHMEMRNRGFINARPLVAMVVGTMGKGKTTMLTDMCLSTEIMFRDKAFEKLLENDLKFPYFPYINLENELRKIMSFHVVYNLATVKLWVRKKAARWRSSPSATKCFGYEYERYGLFYDDKLKVVDVWDVIETYAQLYFIYITESSLLVSNYSIRTDCLLQDLGNFPLWDSDFFRRNSKLIDSFSRHAHILDFDFLRLGKTVIENNAQRHALEFGIVAVSEIGKERRNALELRERNVKLSDGETNQKNDGFNDGLKMRRQAATVDNYAFLKIISDEQRPESFGADARDMFDIISINEKREDGFAMPFFSLGELLYSAIFSCFQTFYSQYRFLRGDNSLSMYLLKSIAAKIEHYYKGLHNLFGYNVLKVQVENGTLDGSYSENKYFFCWKKIYSKRFSTDCMSAFWEERALRSPVGLNDLREYETAKATWEELKTQNSYFIAELTNNMRGDIYE